MKKTLALLGIGIVMLNCSNDDDNQNQTNCDFKTLVDASQYANNTTDQFQLNRLEINDNCLEVDLSASGCDGSTWTIELIDSEAILESSPVQRNLKLTLQNEELCEAFITRVFTFDVSNLQLDGNRVQLNITNSDKSILYEY